jgi:glycosyltransferase involved in cell wall biosynthesis
MGLQPRVLFITNCYPPKAESQTTRNAYLIKGLRNARFQVTVVAPRTDGGDSSLSELLPEGISTIWTRPSPYDQMRVALQRCPVRFLGWQALRVLSVTGGYFLVPDVHAGWQWYASRSARAVCETWKPDVIVSSSGTNTSHITAARLATEYRIPWVADLGDPWALNPLPPAGTPVIRRINEYIEGRVIPGASALTLTTEETAKAYRRWLKERAPSCRVIPCGFEPDDFSSDPSSDSHDGVATLVHVGATNLGGRNVRPMLEVLASGSWHFHLLLVGAVPSRFIRYANRSGVRNVEFRGWVSYRDSLDYIRKASVLLLYGNLGHLQIPAKTYMYLASGKPILYIGSEREDMDPTWRLLRDFEGVMRCTNTRGSITHALNRVNGRLLRMQEQAAQRIHNRRLGAFEWKHLGNDFARVVREAVG